MVTCARFLWRLYVDERFLVYVLKSCVLGISWYPAAWTQTSWASIARLWNLSGGRAGELQRFLVRTKMQLGRWTRWGLWQDPWWGCKRGGWIEDGREQGYCGWNTKEREPVTLDPQTSKSHGYGRSRDEEASAEGTGPWGWCWRRDSNEAGWKVI